MPTHTGCAAKAYYNTGTNASPTWVEIPMAKDVTINIESSDLDSTTRESECWKMSAQGLRTFSADMQLLYKPGTTAYDALRAAYLAKTPQEYAFMDGAIATTGSEGFRVYGEIFSFGQEQGLDALLTNDLTIKPVTNLFGGAADELEVPNYLVVA